MKPSPLQCKGQASYGPKAGQPCQSRTTHPSGFCCHHQDGVRAKKWRRMGEREFPDGRLGDLVVIDRSGERKPARATGRFWVKVLEKQESKPVRFWTQRPLQETLISSREVSK